MNSSVGSTLLLHSMQFFEIYSLSFFFPFPVFEFSVFFPCESCSILSLIMIFVKKFYLSSFVLFVDLICPMSICILRNVAQYLRWILTRVLSSYFNRRILIYYQRDTVTSQIRTPSFHRKIVCTWYCFCWEDLWTSSSIMWMDICFSLSNFMYTYNKMRSSSLIVKVYIVTRVQLQSAGVKVSPNRSVEQARIWRQTQT